MSTPSIDDSTTVAAGENMMYILFTLVVQTFFFGGYTILMIISTRMHLRRGLNRRSFRVLFFIGLFMYLISTAFWSYAVADAVGRLQKFIDPNNPHYTLFSNRVTTWFNWFNAVVLINFVLSDGIVIWRAWVVCNDRRKLLIIPILFLLITLVSTAALIVLRSAGIHTPELEDRPWFTPAINVLQVANMAMSLLSNIGATAMIGITAWRHRRVIRASLSRDSKASQVLLLLVESGVLYCLASMMGMAAVFVHLPARTLNDLYNPVHIQIAGAYAPAILLLLGSQPADETEYLGTISIPVATSDARGQRSYTIRARRRASRAPFTVLSVIQFAQPDSDLTSETELEVSSQDGTTMEPRWVIPTPAGLGGGFTGAKSFGTDLELNLGKVLREDEKER